ncbi:Scm-like with four MBT domain protein 1 [Taenia crassiceps]|uniref:Scm-like with four MBT domain protein 1 n=1 Tax=Taenia crassiceps TaxID=6207 RepID=A0ABR4QKS8_9CEST
METGSEPAPFDLFRHVEKSENLNFVPHQIVEVDLAVLSKNSAKNIPRGIYFWPCEIISSTGVTIKLRWCCPSEKSHPDSTAEAGSCRENHAFWMLFSSLFWELVHPIGWANSHGGSWIHPSQISVVEAPRPSPSKKSRLCYPTDNPEFMQKITSFSVPKIIFDKRAVFLRDIVGVGDYLECKTLSDPSSVWPVQILKKYSGRLVVAWLGVDVQFVASCKAYVCSNVMNSKCVDNPVFSIFMWDPRIRLLGWSLSHSLVYKPPHGLMIPPMEITPDFINSLSPINDITPWKGLFLFAPEPPKHTFAVGSKLEAFDNLRPEGARPATVTKILSDRYFFVRFDALPADGSAMFTEPREFIGHVGMPQIMPPKMCDYYGLRLLPPENWPSDKPFCWHVYARMLFNLSAASSSLPSYLKLTNDSYQSLMKHLSVSVDRFFTTASPRSKNPQEFQIDTYSPLQNVGAFGTARSRRLKTDATDNSGLWASRDFCPGMKLEMALPSFMWESTHLTPSGDLEFHESPICTVTVIRCQAGLLWLLPDLPENWSRRFCPDHPINKPVVIESSSTSLYPLGWSRANGHPFVPPASYLQSTPSHLEDPPIWQNPTGLKQSFLQIVGASEIKSFYARAEVCPPIYLNASCYVGPHILKSKFDSLPRMFGPGPVERTLVAMLSRLASAIDKPVRVLRGLEADWVTKLSNNLCSINWKRRKEAMRSEGLRRWHSGMVLTALRVRCPRKGTYLSLPFEVCKRARAVDEFCRQICIGLEACPFLLSTRRLDVLGDCPLRCNDLIKSHRVASENCPPMVLITDDTIVSTACLLNTEMRISRGNNRRPLVVSSRLLTSRSLLPSLLYNWNPITSDQDSDTSGEGGARPLKRPRSRRMPPRTADRAVDTRMNRNNQFYLLLNGEASLLQSVEVPTLTSNPIRWSPLDLAAYLTTTDCNDLSSWLASQAVDGQSFMLLPPAHELHTEMGLPWELSVKIAQHADRLRLAYMKQLKDDWGR